MHIHGLGGNFGFGQHSTIHIEGIFGTVKLYITRIYNKLPDSNFILFLRDAELRYLLRYKSYIEKETELKEIFKYVFESIDYQLYALEELSDNNNYDY